MTQSGSRRSKWCALRDFLIDHHVGAQQDRLQHDEAESLGGLEVHSHPELGRELNRKLSCLLAEKTRAT
jgi:hypothetical protein